MDQEIKLRELRELRARVQQLENEIAQKPEENWRSKHFYTAYHALAGFVLGMFGAATSLLFNIIGSLAIGQHPLEIIRLYLTFPLGEKALELDLQNGGLILAIGCCLYLATGMFLGMVFHLILCRFFEGTSFAVRYVVVTLLSLGLWVINFYGILSWLQPALIGGNWILERIPWWVAASTHLVFGWTMLLVQPLGVFLASPTSTEAP